MTVIACQGLPVGVLISRAFSSFAIALADCPSSSFNTGRRASALASASSMVFGLMPPSFLPLAFNSASADLVRSEISVHSRICTRLRRRNYLGSRSVY